MKIEARLLPLAALSFALAACGSGNQAPAAAEESAAVPENPAAGEPAAAVPAAEAPATEPAQKVPAKAATPPTEAKPVAKSSPDIPIRGKGGLEGKCQARVGKEVGAKVIGTNRIEESQASIDIYINVEGAQAPWRCRGYRNGNIEGIMYTGDEGAL